MIEIICDKTGIAFQADSRRQKNHPRISRLLNDAAGDKHNPNAYTVALTACREIKERGGMTIDDAITYIENRLSGNCESNTQARQQAAQAQRELAQRMADRKRQRAEQNAHLAANGYKWGKEYANDDEFEEGEPSKWVLRSPDGRDVSVAQALDEIARGANVVLAEISAQEADAARKRQERIAAENADRDAYHTALTQVRALGHIVEGFDDSEFTVLYEKKNYQTLTHIERVMIGQINGVDCGSAYTYWGGHDWIEETTYYCADPSNAGLIAIK